MVHIFKLIRIQNLLIIALTQYLFRYTILLPIMDMEHITPSLSHINFAIIVMSTLLIAAAGYAINDYFDLRIDRINKRKNIIVGKHFSRRKVMTLHTIFSITGVIMGVYVSYKAGALKLAAINLVMATLLWLYSVKYKAYFLVGNLLVSFAAAITIIVVWLFDTMALISTHKIIIINAHLLTTFLWLYAGFAFVVTLIREVIKDVEDVEGDRKVGCSTIPVVMGVKRTKYVLTGLIVLSLIALSYVCYIVHKLPGIRFVFWYLVIAVVLPFIYIGYVTIVAKKKDDFTFMSKIAKFIMLAGVLSMFLIFNRF
jgi:4-hydroxybenzoate polyprenyltransferase